MKTATSSSHTLEYPKSESDYELHEVIGTGVSATVWRATCKPLKIEVAVKLLDLERQDPTALEEIRRETQTMRMLSHPNLLAIHCCFVSGQNLWLVMPYLSGGSCYHLLKWKHEKGFEEHIIATILKGMLQALDYCHRNQLIHRDIKAGNILVDGDGSIKLADFGVSASSWGDQANQRHKTFVGTPCWMAPEVMDQSVSTGYNSAADIWSVGITILELAHGHAPFAKHSPLKVLLMTLQEPAPTLKDDADKHFSKSLRELVSVCLNKDPTKRPTAAKLLEHRFLKEAKKNDFIAAHLLQGEPKLGDRMRRLKEREAKRRQQHNGAQDGACEGQMEQRNQMEYVRGVSAWDFDVAQLKEDAKREELPSLPEGQEVTAFLPQEAPAPGAPGAVGAGAAGGGVGASQVMGSSSPEVANSKKVKHKGRFDVYEEDDEASKPLAALKTAAQSEISSSSSPRHVPAQVQQQPPAPKSSLSLPISVDTQVSAPSGGAPGVVSPTSGATTPSHGVSLPQPSTQQPATQPEKKEPSKKGRFSVVETKEDKPLSRAPSVKDTPKPDPGINRTSSKADDLHRTNQASNQIMQAFPQIIPQLHVLQSQQASQQEMIDTLVKQVVALSRGDDTSMAFDVGPSHRGPELMNSLSDMQKSLAIFVEDNRRLTQRNAELTKQVQDQAAEIEALRQGKKSE